VSKKAKFSMERKIEGRNHGLGIFVFLVCACGEYGRQYHSPPNHYHLSIPPPPIIMPFWPAYPTPHHSNTPIILETKAKPLPFPDFATSLLTPFRANPLLFNGHLQTCWTAVKWNDPHTIYYARQRLRSPADGGHFAVDFAVLEPFPSAPASTEAAMGGKLPPRTRDMMEEEVAKLGSDDDTPMVIALHGLSGGSYELYLRSVLAPLTRKVEEGGSGFAACVVNARGCALSTVTTGQLFNARFTADLRQTVKYLQEVYPRRPLYALGFSFGANILTNVSS